VVGSQLAGRSLFSIWSAECLVIGSQLVGWSAGQRSVGCRSVGQLVGVGWLVGWLAGWFALGWLLVSWSVGCGSGLVGRSKFVGQMVSPCLVVVDLAVVVWTNLFT
jgi:hypothetical protein